MLRGPAVGSAQSLEALLERWLSFYERRVFEGGCLFLVSAVGFKGHEGAVRDALTGAVERQLEALEQGVVSAQQNGALNAERDPAQTAFELHSILVGADALYHVHEDPFVFERARRAIGALLCQPRGFL